MVEEKREGREERREEEKEKSPSPRKRIDCGEEGGGCRWRIEAMDGGIL